MQPVTAPPLIDVETVQRKLIRLGYHEISAADGLWGSKTAAAPPPIRTTRGYPARPSLTRLWSLRSRASPTDGIGRSDRVKFTAKDIAPAVTAVKQTLWQRFWAKVAGFGTMIAAAVNGISDHAGAREYVRPFTSWFLDVPGWLWLVGIAGVALLIYISANKATESIVDAKRTGRLN